ncbi:MAG: gliding motility-associated lipoprotein GldD [Patiriisocius sp.]|jgi:gliding motility-associated lipoprotein GldD
MKICIYLLSCILLIACNDDVLIKPNAKLRLDYPVPVYQKTKANCNYNFDINQQAILLKVGNCGAKIAYPNMNAAVYITYQKVRNNNLDSLLYDAQKLAYNHDRKANGIPEKLFVNPGHTTYGVFYSINGDAASQAHFYLTDSVQRFVTGSLYFDAKPNFDSIYPAVMYLREDIMHLMETLEWE